MKTKISALICLISIITVSTTVGIAEAQPLFLPPQTVIVSLSLSTGSPPTVGSTFYVDIEIIARPAIEVYAWQVELDFCNQLGDVPKAVMPLNIIEGPFLPNKGPTVFMYSIDLLGGVISIGNTLLEGLCTGGASVSPPMPNLLARVRFGCTTPGPTLIELAYCSFLDCNLTQINCKCRDLYFYQLPK